jgi:DNA-binding MarR family transcriptional regulator
LGAEEEQQDFVGTLEADSVLEGVNQYITLLDPANSLSIAIILTLWEANHVQMLANHRAFDKIGLPVSVTGTRLTILRTLYFAPGKKMALSAISKATNTNLTIVSNLVEALQKGGLVRRVGSPQDRRVSLAELTPEGEEAFAEILPVMSARMADACSGFTEEEKVQFLGYLQRLL